MSTGDQKRKQDQQKKLFAKYYGHLNFQPKISEKSKLIGREPSLNELIKTRTEAPEVETMRFKKEQEELQECTFKPSISKAAEEIKSIYVEDKRLMERINNENTSKEDRLERNR